MVTLDTLVRLERVVALTRKECTSSKTTTCRRDIRERKAFRLQQVILIASHTNDDARVLRRLIVRPELTVSTHRRKSNIADILARVLPAGSNSADSRNKVKKNSASRNLFAIDDHFGGGNPSKSNKTELWCTRIIANPIDTVHPNAVWTGHRRLDSAAQKHGRRGSPCRGPLRSSLAPLNLASCAIVKTVGKPDGDFCTALVRGGRRRVQGDSSRAANKSAHRRDKNKRQCCPAGMYCATRNHRPDVNTSHPYRP